MPGFVYAIRNLDTGHIKFGRSKNPATRLRDLQQNTGCSLVLEATVSEDVVDDDTGEQHADGYLEFLILQYCRESNIRGEWFVPSPRTTEVLDAMKTGGMTVGALVSRWKAVCGDDLKPINDVDLLRARVIKLEQENEKLSEQIISYREHAAYKEAYDRELTRFQKRVTTAWDDFQNWIKTRN